MFPEPTARHHACSRVNRHGTYRIAWLVFLLVSVANARATEEIRLCPGVPLFADASTDAVLVGVITNEGKISVKAHRRIFVETHPLARYYDYYHVSLDADTNGWACPDLRCQEGAGAPTIISVYSPPLWQKIVLGVLIFCLAGSIGCWWNISRRSGMKSTGGGNCMSGGWPPLIVILTRWCLLFLAIMQSHNVVTIAFDEVGYFNVASNLLKGNVSGPWNYLFGQGMLFVPFILITGARQYYDMAIIFSFASGFLVMPSCLLFTYAIIRRLNGSRSQAFIATILLAVFPFLYHYFPFWTENLFKSFVALPKFSFCFRLYTTLIGTGFNGMSDPWAMCVVLLCIWLSLKYPAHPRCFLLISGLFGIACLIRLASIFFAPVIAWLFWTGIRKQRWQSRRVFISALGCIAIFLVALSPQFAVNFHHFGNIWIFPYILHNGAHDGFEWSFFPSGLTFLVKCNYAIWAVGLTSLLYVRDRHTRTCLILWFVPSALYFLGYNHTFCDAVRYLLPTYGALFGGMVLAAVWLPAFSSRCRIWTLAAMTGCVCFLTPSAYIWTHQLPFDLQKVPAGNTIATALAFGAVAVALAGLYMVRQDRTLSTFLLIFLALYLPGKAIPFLILILILLALAIVHFAKSLSPLFSPDNWSNTRLTDGETALKAE